MRSRPKSTAEAVAKALRDTGTDLRLNPLIRQRVKLVLDLVDGNLSVASRVLGINRRTLQRRQSRKK